MNIPEILVANGTGAVLVSFLLLLRVRGESKNSVGTALFCRILVVTLLAQATETISFLLDHLIVFQQLLELLAGAVVVVHTLLLAGARGACGGRDGLFDFGVCLAQCLDHAFLAGAGCAGNYKQKFIIRHEMFLPPLMLYPPARRRGLPPFRAEGRTARHDRSP